MLKGPQHSPGSRGGPTPPPQSWGPQAPALSTSRLSAGPAPQVLPPGGDPGRLRFPRSPEESAPVSDPLPRPYLVSPSHASRILLDFGPLRGSI